MARPDRWFALALTVAVVVFAGCDAEHIFLADVPTAENLGAVSMALQSAPVIAPDGASVIYIRVTPAPEVVSKDRATGNEAVMFPVPSGSSLSTLNYATGTLLLSVANNGAARHILEYGLHGDTIRNFDVPAGFQDTWPSISPDGSRLAFIRTADGSIAKTLSVRSVASGSSSVSPHVTLASGETILSVRWLDDSRILVSAQLGASTVVNKIQDLTSGIASNATALGLNATPDPFGKHNVFLLAAGTAQDLWLSGVSGDPKTQMTNSQSSKSALNWSIDGREVVYLARSGNPLVSSLEVFSLPPLQ